MGAPLTLKKTFMECEEFQLRYDIRAECCESCHEDEDMGFGDDLWFRVEGKDWHVCCKMINTYEKEKDAKSQ